MRGDAAVAAKALQTFRRETDLLEFKGGLLGDEALDPEQILALARLPPATSSTASSSASWPRPSRAWSAR